MNAKSNYETNFKKVSDSSILCGHCQKETDHIYIQVVVDFIDRGIRPHRINNVPLTQQPNITYEEVLNICFKTIADEEGNEYTPLEAINLRNDMNFAKFYDCCPNCGSTGAYTK